MSKKIKIATMIVAASIFLPVKKMSGSDIQLGYPLRYLGIYFDHIVHVSGGQMAHLFSFIAINALNLLINIFLVCLVLTIFQKLRHVVEKHKNSRL